MLIQYDRNCSPLKYTDNSAEDDIKTVAVIVMYRMNVKNM